MHTCIHAYMHTCIHAYMHTCIHAYVHTCIRAYVHTCIQTYIQHPHTHIPTYLHTYLHTCILTCIHTYIHTYTHTPIHPSNIYIHALKCEHCSLRSRTKVLQSVLLRITNGKAISDHCGNLWRLGGLYGQCDYCLTHVKNPLRECWTYTGCSLPFVQL